MNVSPLQRTFSHWPAMEYLKLDGYVKQLNFHFVILEAANILGYFPRIGSIIGVARVFFAVTQLNQGSDVKVRIPFIVRGLAEISSLRNYLVPIDLINTYLVIITKQPQE